MINFCNTNDGLATANLSSYVDTANDATITGKPVSRFGISDDDVVLGDVSM